MAEFADEAVRGADPADPYGPAALLAVPAQAGRRGVEHGRVLRPHGGRPPGPPDWTPRELDPVFQDALWSRLERTARLMGRGAPTGLVLRRPDGQTAVAHRGTPVVTATGEPSELLLFLYGRQSAAEVELDGDKDAIAKLHEAKQLGI